MKNILFSILLLTSSIVFSQNLMQKNVSFLSGFSNWKYGATSADDNVPVADFAVVEDGYEGKKACEVKVKIPGDVTKYNDVFLQYQGVPIKKGKKYRVIFHVKTTEYNDDVLVTIGSGSSPKIEVLEERLLKFKGDNKWHKISFTFVAKKTRKNVDFKDLSLFVGFNHRFGKFIVDEFSIVNIK